MESSIHLTLTGTLLHLPQTRLNVICLVKLFSTTTWSKSKILLIKGTLRALLIVTVVVTVVLVVAVLVVTDSPDSPELNDNLCP